MDSTSATSDAERLKLVSSLYGPGAVTCWLCVVLSVFVSWTLNKEYRKDNITKDVFAALSLPVVAAGHLIYQIVIYEGDRSAILTTSDPTLLPRVAAIEAPLNICETFSTLALSLFVLAEFKLHIRRCVVVGAVGLLCFFAETALFVICSTSSIRRSNFSRPFLVNERAAMMPITIIAIALTLASVPVKLQNLVTAAKQTLADGATSTAGTANGDNERQLQRQEGLTTSADQGPSDHGSRERTEQTQKPRKAAVEVASMRAITIVSLLFLAASFVATIGFPLGAWGVTAVGAVHSFAWRLRFFIPETPYTFADLDQVVPLVGGAATLLYSIYDALKSRFCVQKSVIDLPASVDSSG